MHVEQDCPSASHRIWRCVLFLRGSADLLGPRSRVSPTFQLTLVELQSTGKSKSNKICRWRTQLLCCRKRTYWSGSKRCAHVLRRSSAEDDNLTKMNVETALKCCFPSAYLSTKPPLYLRLSKLKQFNQTQTLVPLMGFWGFGVNAVWAPQQAHEEQPQSSKSQSLCCALKQLPPSRLIRAITSLKRCVNY